MLQRLLTQAETWLQENHHCVVSSQTKNSPNTKKGRKLNNKKHSSPDEQGVRHQKKPSMKTAEDVISRIMWDAALPAEEFKIGYLDRFLGVVEKQFDAFSWEDLASVDYDTLAIPKHRIQYFKYKEVIVWDKTKRLDNVFGSVGSGFTIQEIMENYVPEKVTTDPSIDDREYLYEYDKDFQGYEDDDSDDGVVIDVGDQDWDEENISDDKFGYKLTGKDAYWGGKMRPTHFLCLRINNPELVTTIGTMQDRIVEMIPEYAPCVIPPERLHVTLCTLGLDTDESVAAAVKEIKRIGAELRLSNPASIILTFNDIKQFFNNTLYASVEENPSFMDIIEHLRVCVREAGIEIRDVFDFTPHMTLMKVSRQTQRDMRCPYLDPRVVENFGNRNAIIGTQVFDNIYLCEMSQRTTDQGFYISYADIDFTTKDFKSVLRACRDDE